MTSFTSDVTVDMTSPSGDLAHRDDTNSFREFMSRPQVLWTSITLLLLVMCILAALVNGYIWYVENVKRGKVELFKSPSMRPRENRDNTATSPPKVRMMKF